MNVCTPYLVHDPLFVIAASLQTNWGWPGKDPEAIYNYQTMTANAVMIKNLN